MITGESGSSGGGLSLASIGGDVAGVGAMSLGAKPGSRLAFGDTSSGARSGTGSMTRLLSGLIGRGGIRAGAHGASAAVRVAGVRGSPCVVVAPPVWGVDTRGEDDALKGVDVVAPARRATSSP